MLSFWLACFGWSAGYTELEGAHGCGHPGSAVRNGTLKRRLMWVPRLSVSDRGRGNVGRLVGRIGDLTVARAGFHSSIYLALRGACASRISGPGRARARPWLEVRLADASPTDGVQDTAATTGGRAGVQQVKHGCDRDHWRVRAAGVQQVKPRI